MKRIFIDMDNVLVDFQSGIDQMSEELKEEYAGRLDEIPGIFVKMKPMPGAIEAVNELQKHYDLFILSTAPWRNPSAWSDKVEWVTKYLDDVFHKRLVITHRKDLCQGDYLIDDRGKNGASEFAGKWIQFGTGEFPDWASVLEYLKVVRSDEYLKETCYKRLVIGLANQYQNHGLTFEELLSIGNEGLRETIVKYEPTSDINFIRYAVPVIRQRILQALQSNETKRNKTHKMDTRLEKLSTMLEHHYRTWVEHFKNEETGQDEPIERHELIEMEITDEERQFIEEIADDVASLSDEDLASFQVETSFYDTRIADKIYLERVRRGDEAYAESIHDVPTLQTLCDKGNRWAAYALYQKYKWGDEAQGIFIDRAKANQYYDISGDIQYKDEWKDIEDPGEPNPGTWEYVLTGTAESLNDVQELICDLCKRYGIPENKEDGLGLFLPQRALIKALVGSDSEFYRGNLLNVERTAQDRLVITVESDNCDPLLYALRKRFGNLTVELDVLN